MTTTLARKYDIQQNWYVIDAKDQVLGRLAVKIANLLRGRGKAIYTPHEDTGDFVIVVNADKVKLTGNKINNKQYMFYSGYMGGESYRKVSELLRNKPTFVIQHAVKGMLPRNRIARHMIKKLKIYAGPEHAHEAQNPIPFTV